MSENDSETSLIALSHVLRTSFSLVYNTEFDFFAKNFIRVAVVGKGGLDGTPTLL